MPLLLVDRIVTLLHRACMRPTAMGMRTKILNVNTKLAEESDSAGACVAIGLGLSPCTGHVTQHTASKLQHCEKRAEETN